jgi:hypothetical protein
VSSEQDNDLSAVLKKLRADLIKFEAEYDQRSALMNQKIEFALRSQRRFDLIESKIESLIQSSDCYESLAGRLALLGLWSSISTVLENNIGSLEANS